MGYFKRSEEKEERSFRRLQPDIRVPLGAGEIKYLQPLAQSKTDGKFYAYVKGDEDKGVIAGLYTGEDKTAIAGETGSLTTQIVIAQDDIQGIDWAKDFTAISQLKFAGVIFAPLITGTKEA